MRRGDLSFGLRRDEVLGCMGSAKKQGDLSVIARGFLPYIISLSMWRREDLSWFDIIQSWFAISKGESVKYSQFK